MVHTLVRIPHEGKALFFRVMAVDLTNHSLHLKLERYTLFWCPLAILDSTFSLPAFFAQRPEPAGAYTGVAIHPIRPQCAQSDPPKLPAIG